MDSKNPLLQALMDLVGDRNTITIHRAVVEFLEGNFEAALLLEQLLYWTPKSPRGDGRVAKSYSEWREEIYLTRYGVEKARNYLKKRGLLSWEIERFRNSPTTFYRLDLDELARQWGAFIQTREEEPQPSEEEKQETPADFNKWPKEEQKAPVDFSKWSEEAQEAPADFDKCSKEAPQAPAEISKWPEETPQAPVEISKPPAEISRSLAEISKPPAEISRSLTEITTKITTEPTTEITTATKPAGRLNTRASPPEAPRTVVAVAAELPDEIVQALKALGWGGSMAEIARAWQNDPGRVQAWLDYARRKGLGAGWLRKTLREDPGYPPAEPVEAGEDPDRYRSSPFAAFFENGGDGEEPEEAQDTVPTAGETPPDVGQTAPVPAPTSPDMGGGVSGEATPNAPPLPPDVQRWWDIALGQLRAEMPKASFETWVRPARPKAWQAEDGHAVLTVAAANDYARRWLQERVGRILAHKLTGLAGQPVSLEFVVE